MNVTPPSVAPLRRFMGSMAHVIEHSHNEAQIVLEGSVLLKQLVARDDWLPEEFAQAHSEHYQQYLLHGDAQERFSVVSFVSGVSAKWRQQPRRGGAAWKARHAAPWRCGGGVTHDR